MIFQCQDYYYFYEVYRDGDKVVAIQWIKDKNIGDPRSKVLDRLELIDTAERDDDGDFVHFEQSSAEEECVKWCLVRRIRCSIPNLEQEAYRANRKY